MILIMKWVLGRHREIVLFLLLRIISELTPGQNF